MTGVRQRLGRCPAKSERLATIYRTAVAVVVAATVIVAPRAAQASVERNQWMIGVSAAATEMPTNERMGSAASLGVAVGYGLTDRLSAEVSYRHWEAERGAAATGWVSGMWLLSRAKGRVWPFVLAGGGVTNFEPDGRSARRRGQGFVGVGVFGDVLPRTSWRLDVRAVRTVCSSRIEPHVQAGLTFYLGDRVVAPRDTDGDGVADSADACPDTPLGVPVDARGCPLTVPDDDDDAVPIQRDECPGTETDAVGCPPEVLDGTWVDSTGRALRRNSDGVWIDSAGRPVEQAADGRWVDSAGRPLARESDGVWVDSLGRPIPLVVKFDFDEAELRPDDVQRLSRHAAFLRAAEAWTVRVEGHTDPTGPNRYNQGLSERRADAVRAFLVAAGVEPDRIGMTGFGEDQLIAGASDAENRRAVVIYVE